MISTSVAAVVVGLMAVGTAPDWQTDYRAALARVSVEHKPVAVFIAGGADGYAKLVAEGTLGTDATGLLQQKYVPLFVNTTTDAGRETAKSFGMAEGLVISDRTGGVQAYRHEGHLSQAELTSSLRVYADAVTPAVVADAQPVTTSTSFYPTVNQVPAAAPVAFAQPTAAFAPAPVFAAPPPAFAPARSTCPNGRCPYAR